MSAESTIEGIVAGIATAIRAIDGSPDWREDFDARPGSVLVGMDTIAPSMRAVCIEVGGLSSVEPTGARTERYFLTLQVHCFTGASGATPQARLYDAAAMGSDVHRAIFAYLRDPTTPGDYGRMDAGAIRADDQGAWTMQYTIYYHAADGAL